MGIMSILHVNLTFIKQLSREDWIRTNGAFTPVRFQDECVKPDSATSRYLASRYAKILTKIIAITTPAAHNRANCSLGVR